jgi:hypothetical protein
MQQQFIYKGSSCNQYSDKGLHENCECDILFVINDHLFPYPIHQVIFRYKDGIKRKYCEMYQELLLSISYNWSLFNNVITRRHGDIDVVQAVQSISTDIGMNQIPVPYPFPGTMPVSTKYKLNEAILEPAKLWDVKYFKSYCNIKRDYSWFKQHIWKEVLENGNVYAGVSWETKPDNLLIESLKVSSFYNIAFTGLVLDTEKGKQRYKYNYYSQENLYPKKITKLIQKYNKPTHTLPPLLRSNKQLIPMAIASMAKDEGWDTCYHSVRWSYERAVKECIKVSFDASAGSRPGGSRVIKEAEGVYKHVGVKGKKLEQAEYMAKTMDEAVKNFRERGVFQLPPDYAKIVLKSEVHHVETVSREHLEKMSMKAREYFIQGFLTVLLSQLVQNPRQKIERGNLIRIGMDWNRGGMQEFAEYFRYDDPDMRYITFDISGYDTSVIKLFLQIYSRWARQYMKFDNKEEKELFLAMLDLATQRLTTKITQIIGNVWRIIDGVMPSGAFETSHGDSWITALVYYCFFEYLSSTDIEFRTRYRQSKIKKDLMLSVYGDDNVIGFHKDFLKWFTEENFTMFFLQFGNFTLRDFQIHLQFLSVPDGRGGLKTKGVVFLQKYAIKLPEKFNYPGMPKIVHYRPVQVNIKKFYKGSGDYRTEFDYFLSALTGVYDNPFNQVWYDFCAHMYLHFKPKEEWQDKIMQVMKNTNGYVTRMMRKTHMDVSVLLQGFPTVAQIVNISLHDRNHHKFNHRDIWTYDLYDIEVQLRNFK